MEQFLKYLEKLGLNTRKLQWKLYQWEKRRENGQGGIRLPARLHWLTYPHKFCLKCGALAERDVRQCESCGARLPSMLGYKLFRLVGVVLPQSTPATIGIFMVVMVGLFVLQMVMGGPLVSVRFGAWASPLARVPHEYWRILAFGLVHGGLLHIGFNMFALSQIGPALESHVGRSRMLVVITISQITCAVASTMTGVGWTVGASGWLFGLIGFGIAYFHTMGGPAKMYRDMLVRWALYALVFGFVMPNVNNAAHVGGLVGGLVLGFIPEAHPRRTRLVSLFWEGGFWVSLVLWTGALGMLVHSVFFVENADLALLYRFVGMSMR
jgi:membrane associated rhomboid family serine protease